MTPPTTLAEMVWRQQNATFGLRRKAGDLIAEHIRTHGPWSPCTADNSLAFLTRTGRDYRLVVPKET